MNTDLEEGMVCTGHFILEREMDLQIDGQSSVVGWIHPPGWNRFSLKPEWHGIKQRFTKPVCYVER